MSIVVTSAGGPAAENIIKNLKLIPWYMRPKIHGIDMDKYMIELSSADVKHIVPRAMNADGSSNEIYIACLQGLRQCCDAQLLIPQSDVEVFVCSRERKRLPPMVLPNHEIIELCQDKGNLYDFLDDWHIDTPPYKNPTPQNIRELSFESPNYGVWSPSQWKYPCWVRARHGAGGNKGFICRDWRDFRNMAEFYRDREKFDWQMVKLLEGRDYSWTSLWDKGKLVTSVLKERLKWVYDRIGTSAVQRTVHNEVVNNYCKSIVEALTYWDSELTGIMMIDMKEDKDDGKFYITEINSGRLGTVNYFYGYASQEVFHDNSRNIPYLLWLMVNDRKLPELPQFNAFPKDLYWIRHIDMGMRLIRNA